MPIPEQWSLASELLLRLGAGGKPSTWFPPGWLVERRRILPALYKLFILLYFTFYIYCHWFSARDLFKTLNFSTLQFLQFFLQFFKCSPETRISFLKSLTSSKSNFHKHIFLLNFRFYLLLNLLLLNFSKNFAKYHFFTIFKCIPLSFW